MPIIQLPTVARPDISASGNGNPLWRNRPSNRRVRARFAENDYAKEIGLLVALGRALRSTNRRLTNASKYREFPYRSNNVVANRPAIKTAHLTSTWRCWV